MPSDQICHCQGTDQKVLLGAEDFLEGTPRFAQYSKEGVL